MTHKLFLALALSAWMPLQAPAQQPCPLIPLPAHHRPAEGRFLLNSQTAVIAADSAFQASAYYLRNQVLRHTGMALGAGPRAARTILLQRAPGSPGAYTLAMDGRQVRIQAADDEGMFYGVNTLLQLLLRAGTKDDAAAIPCWEISDAPQYAWRGVMLDESRHFFGKEVVREMLDQMALLKLNRFHWHLTDQPGWRLQIRRYPRLALVGGLGDYSDSLRPARYYTQEDIREIVAYARERHITVIPEVDMPGHATAANRAYPAYSGGGEGRWANFTFNPGREDVYGFLTDILREVAVLFPAGMIHLGGDEVAYGSQGWTALPAVQQLMTRERLGNAREVEQYFFRRMTDSALGIFRRVLAWDEVADGNLPADSVIIFWWRHDRPEQLRKAFDKGYHVVLCPRIPLYFDFVQDSAHRQGRRWKGDFSSLDRVYAFSGADLPAAGRPGQVLGMQADLWTETVRSRERLEYLLFPRMAALAEAAWTAPAGRDYALFLSRLKDLLPLYRAAGIHYYDPLAPLHTPEIIDP